MKTFFAKPHITEKSMAKASDGIYQFIIPTWATKEQVARFVATHFGVTVVNTTTNRIPANQVVFKRKPGTQAQFKKASLRLKAGQSIDVFSLPVETTPVPKETVPSTTTTPSTEGRVTVRSRSKKKMPDEPDTPSGEEK